MEPTIPVYLLPFLICLLRIADVTLGTLRTVAHVRGTVVVAPILGFFEVTIWVLAISKVMTTLDNPFNVLGYALGFALGNWVGVTIERKLALGQLVIRIISRIEGETIAAALRERGLRVTEFEGRGSRGPVTLLYVMLERSDAGAVQTLAEEIDPECFVVVEDTTGTNRTLTPTLVPRTGWRSPFKKK